MKRSSCVSLVVFLLCSLTAATTYAQTKPAPPPPAAAGPPPAAGKWVAPVKGVATVEVIRGASKRLGKEIITSMTIKNTSTGSISLLKVEELWYDAKRTVVSSGTSYYRKPFLPGEVITVELKSPLNGTPDVSQISFAHANGRVDAKPVKKFSS